MKNQLVAKAAALLALDSLTHGNHVTVGRSAESFSWGDALEASRIALMGQATWDSLAVR